MFRCVGRLSFFHSPPLLHIPIYVIVFALKVLCLFDYVAYRDSVFFCQQLLKNLIFIHYVGILYNIDNVCVSKLPIFLFKI